jgi:hypothetical protein
MRVAIGDAWKSPEARAAEPTMTLDRAGAYEQLKRDLSTAWMDPRL